MSIRGRQRQTRGCWYRRRRRDKPYRDDGAHGKGSTKYYSVTRQQIMYSTYSAKFRYIFLCCIATTAVVVLSRVCSVLCLGEVTVYCRCLHYCCGCFFNCSVLPLLPPLLLFQLFPSTYTSIGCLLSFSSPMAPLFLRTGSSLRSTLLLFFSCYFLHPLPLLCLLFPVSFFGFSVKPISLIVLHAFS